MTTATQPKSDAPPTQQIPTVRVAFNRAEAGGALGDLGTFLPLLLGMVSRCGLHLGHALFFAGVAAVITGMVFAIPIPLQPMKAIAAVAIAEGMTVPEILAAGILTGAAMLLLALTGLIDWLHVAIPRSLVRAIQLALGLKLLHKGLMMGYAEGVWIGADSMALAAVGIALVLWLYKSTRVPAALAVCALGLVTLLVSQPQLFASLHLGIEMPRWNGITQSQWLTGLWRGALPQIPLTTLNSVIAVSVLSADLFSRRVAEPKKLAISVGVLNLLLCPFGAMPMCHGAGGLAAQYRFGGRTGGCIVMFGLVNIILALLFGSSLLVLLSNYPQSVLGVLLGFAGVQLVLVCRDQFRVSSPEFRVSNAVVVVATTTMCLATNTALGFTAGVFIAAVPWMATRIVTAENQDQECDGGNIPPTESPTQMRRPKDE